MSAARDRYHFSFEGYEDDERGPATGFAIVTGFACYEAAKRLANPYGAVQLFGAVSGDGERASFVGLYNGRQYRVTVEPCPQPHHVAELIDPAHLSAHQSEAFAALVEQSPEAERTAA